MSQQQVGSFIPKSPVGSRPTERKRPRQSLGRFGLISIIVFVAAIGVSAGVYVWKASLTTALEQKKETLVEKRKDIQSGEVDLLVTTDRKIENAKKILDDHISIVDFFDLIGDYTVRSVSFKSLVLTGIPGSPYKLTITGVGNDVASLIVQSDVLQDPGLINKVASSRLESTGQGSGEEESVGFTLTATVDPRVLDFQSSLAASDDLDIEFFEVTETGGEEDINQPNQ